ncbi:nonstructural protein 2 [Papilio polyxenes densovirus]|uniref:Nonstructural protein 2 n=1 Tax=Papilio polyxenes densovirus TaxID=1221208 RepID=J7GRK3_9VIRU|nr:nonstructural protein 2 [Papilio polyxenes densovirus]AFP74563.1 nonstructural protein 2 [Papilio polyxenes densovirus]
MLTLLINYCLVWSLLKSLQTKFQVKQRQEYLKKLEVVVKSVIAEWEEAQNVCSSENELVQFLTEEFSLFMEKNYKNDSLETLCDTLEEPKLIQSNLQTMKLYLTRILQNKAMETTDLKGHSLLLINKWNYAIKTPMKLLTNDTEALASSLQRWNEEWESLPLSYANLIKLIVQTQEEFYTTPSNTEEIKHFVKWFLTSGKCLTKEVRTLFGSMKQTNTKKTIQKTSVEDTRPTTISESSQQDSDTQESQLSNHSHEQEIEQSQYHMDQETQMHSGYTSTTQKRKSSTTLKGQFTKKKILKNQPRAISTYYTPASGTTMNAGASEGALMSIQGRIRQSLSHRLTRNTSATLCCITQSGPDGLCTSKWPTDPNTNMFIELNLYPKNQYNPSDSRNNWKRATIRMKVDLPGNSRHAYQIKEIIDAQMSRMENHPETETQSKNSWNNSNSGQHGPWNTY